MKEFTYGSIFYINPSNMFCYLCVVIFNFSTLEFREHFTSYFRISYTTYVFTLYSFMLFSSIGSVCILLYIIMVWRQVNLFSKNRFFKQRGHPISNFRTIDSSRTFEKFFLFTNDMTRKFFRWGLCYSCYCNCSALKVIKV